MARIRTLRPDAMLHRKVGPLGHLAFRTWVGLITQADDEGRVVAEAPQVRAWIFAYHPDISVEDVERAIQEIAGPGLIRLYTANGTRYAVFSSWRDHQKIDRPIASKLPAPPEQFDEPSSSPRRVPDDSSPPEGIGREERRDTRPVRPRKTSDATHGNGRDNGKVPVGYQDAVGHWFAEFERTRGGKPQFTKAEGACLKRVLGSHAVGEVKAVMSHMLTRTQLKHIRERHAYTLHSLVGSWNELWSEYRKRAAEEGETVGST